MILLAQKHFQCTNSRPTYLYE